MLCDTREFLHQTVGSSIMSLFVLSGFLMMSELLVAVFLFLDMQFSINHGVARWQGIGKEKTTSVFYNHRSRTVVDFSACQGSLHLSAVFFCAHAYVSAHTEK